MLAYGIIIFMVFSFMIMCSFSDPYEVYVSIFTWLMFLPMFGRIFGWW